MPVKLYTGLPGAGKTARVVDEILRLQETDPTRPVFQVGIDGLAEGLATTLTPDELHKWWELPPTSIIAIDEAQELMPLDRGQPPEWVKRLSKIRHEGMDLLLTTQHPNMLSSYVRRLVDLHVHLVRKFNTKVVMSFTWPRCVENCEKPSAQKPAQHAVVTLPSRVFDLYKSAEAHTMKRRIPVRAFMLPVLVVLAIAAVVAIPFILYHIKHQVAAVPTAKSATVAKRVQAADDGLRQAHYAQWLAPRVPGLPWTAPAYDQMTVQSQPRVYCIAVADSKGTCGCISEQGTRMTVPADVCRSIAANGVYDPFVKPVEDRSNRRQSAGQAGGADPRRQTAQQAAGGAPPASVVGVDGPHDNLATAPNYVPPTFGPWNPEAL